MPDRPASPATAARAGLRSCAGIRGFPHARPRAVETACHEFPAHTHQGTPVSAEPYSLYKLKRTPFHERIAPLCLPQNWRRWGGCITVGSYDLGIDREYWAIRDAAALIDVSPLMKYLIEGPDAARLLDRIITRDIARLADRAGLLHRLVRRRGQAARRRHGHAPRRADASASRRPSRRCAGCR